MADDDSGQVLRNLLQTFAQHLLSVQNIPAKEFGTCEALQHLQGLGAARRHVVARLAQACDGFRVIAQPCRSKSAFKIKLEQGILIRCFGRRLIECRACFRYRGGIRFVLIKNLQNIGNGPWRRSLRRLATGFLFRFVLCPYGRGRNNAYGNGTTNREDQTEQQANWYAAPH